jgi:hypothetical protein
VSWLAPEILIDGGELVIHRGWPAMAREWPMSGPMMLRAALAGLTLTLPPKGAIVGTEGVDGDEWQGCEADLETDGLG